MDRTERGAAEYRALTDALNDTTPPCTDDPRFILEAHEIHRDELSHLRLTLCRVCPLRPLCAAYGERARPTAGIWAGRTYTARQARTQTPTPTAAPAATHL